MSSKALVLAVASFLVVILIYGPIVTFEVFAKPPKLGPITCHTGQGLPPGQTECCQPTLSSVTGRVLLVFCTTCDDTNPPSNCSPRYLTSGGAAQTNVLPPSGNNTGPITNGQTGLPSSLGNALPTGNNTGTPGKTSIFNSIRNVTAALPINNNTGTLPFGSIIKVPPGTIGSATNPPPTNNNTGNPIAMTSSDNPPGCSKKIPIPPNCTLNPFNNSAAAANKAEQIQTQQSTGHHHKGSNTGASTPTGSNSTSH
jgi:hypothetical protein